MQPIPAQANIRTWDAIARADGTPITTGTVNFYLVALTGANAGKWFRGSDSTWQAAESIAGAMTHRSDGHWYVSVAAAAWTAQVEYEEYGKESGNLHVPYSSLVRCETPQTGDSFARLGTPAGASIAVDVAAAKSDTAAILVDTGTDGVVVATASKTGYSLADNAITAAKIATDALAAVKIASAACNKIADHILRRLQTNAEGSSDGDTLGLGSLYGLIQQAQESSVASGTLTVKKTDGTTTLGTKTVTTTGAADPITGIS